MSIAKRWCFTINNPTPEDYFFWVDGDQDHVSDVMANFEYFIVQEEQGEQGTTHLQGFFILKEKKRMEWIKRRCSQRMHLEVARGTNQQAADYCRKEDTYTGGLRWEMGSLPARAEVKKRDERLQDAAEELDIIKEGYKRPADIPSMTLLQCGFIPAYKELTADVLGPWRQNLKVITMVGPPGTGKSYAIQKWFPDHGRCICGNNGVWFQQPLSNVMVWEEFCGQIQLQRMLQFLDTYPLALEVKGGMRPAWYTIAIITSNTRPDKWYKGEEGGEPGKRSDAILALFDRIGFSTGANVLVRTNGYYLECPVGISVAEARNWFDQQIARIVGTPEPVTDSD